jgi:hypothetical protein
MALAILAVHGSAWSQIAESISDRLETSALRQEVPMAVLEKKDQRGVQMSVTGGLSYSDAEAGTETFSTPFSLKATFNEGKTSARLSGDGYQSVDSGASTASGVADILALVSHRLYTFPSLGAKLVGEAGFTFPTGGEVGSSKSRQRVGASYAMTLTDAWSAVVLGRLTRASADPAPGTSRVARTVSGEVGYKFRQVNDVALSLARSYRPGASGNSQAGVTYSRKLSPAGTGVTGGYVRGFTSGAESDTVYASIALPF